MGNGRLWYGILAALSLALAAPASAETTTTTGAFVTEAPTLTAIGVVWKITGDDNLNATVQVAYRKKGQQEWQKALPLLRIHHEVINAAQPPNAAQDPGPGLPNGARSNPFHYDTGNSFAGSILNLEPGTEYECKFDIADPDGVSGDKEKISTLRTRSAPVMPTAGRVYHVYPSSWTGPKQQPAFLGLLNAYYMGESSSDHGNTFAPRVKPGDTIIVHAGIYESDRFHYLMGVPVPGRNAYASIVDGTYYLTQSGTPDKPIVIKSAGDGEVIFDGAHNGILFNMLKANYNWFEGITVRNTAIAFLLGWRDIAGANGFTLTHMRIYDVGRAVQDEWSSSRDYYIADNIIVGEHDPIHMMSWTGRLWEQFPGFPELVLSEYAIKVYGQGHVVTHNYVADFHDAIDISTYGEPDGTPDPGGTELTGPSEKDDTLAASIDFDHNDMFNMGDNCIEGDGVVQNLRVFENRCFNTAAQSLSAEPVFGGPVYFYRNLVYNTPQGGALKFAETPAGVLVYQNTFVGGDIGPGGPASNAHLRNNLYLGRGDRTPIYSIRTYTNYSTSDYNGFSLNDGPVNFSWESPDFGTAADYDYTHKMPVRRYKTLKEYSAETGQDKHSVILDYNTFKNVPMPNNADPQRLYNPEEMDFSLKPKSAAVDAGMVLPTITDNYTGKAPDLGAFEVGLPMPEYGPRGLVPGSFDPAMMGYRSWEGPVRKGAQLIP